MLSTSYARPVIIRLLLSSGCRFFFLYFFLQCFSTPRIQVVAKEFTEYSSLALCLNYLYIRCSSNSVKRKKLSYNYFVFFSRLPLAWCSWPSCRTPVSGHCDCNHTSLARLPCYSINSFFGFYTFRNLCDIAHCLTSWAGILFTPFRNEIFAHLSYSTRLYLLLLWCQDEIWFCILSYLLHILIQDGCFLLHFLFIHSY